MNPQEVRSFAEREVFPTLETRYESREFSRELWKKMAGAGLFGFLIPTRYGGSGKGPEALVEAIEAFVRGGQDLGLTLSWLDHLLIHSHVIAEFGSEQQREQYLPGLVTGERVGALAVSEPETGANPVKMKARAEREDGTYRIQAHKLFITNGPVADLIIVMARTGPGPGKEGLSAFLLDTTTPGFRVEKEMDFGFIPTSPHGELLFDGCTVPAENLLGDLGAGHVRISRAVFGWERFMGMVLLAAHFRLILEQMIRLRNESALPFEQETKRLLAELHITLEGVREVSRVLACEVLNRTDLDARLTERLLFLGGLLRDWWDRFQPIRKGVSEIPAFPLGILLKDAQLLNVGSQLYEIQKTRVAEKLIERVAAGDSM
jgi:alkylation response protein AidB-like acyl-CoA dehydrogenase